MKMMDQITGKEALKQKEVCFREMEEVYVAMATHIETLVERQKVYDRHLHQVHDRIATLEQNPMLLNTLQTTVRRLRIFMSLIAASSLVTMLWLFLR